MVFRDGRQRRDRQSMPRQLIGIKPRSAVWLYW